MDCGHWWFHAAISRQARLLTAVWFGSLLLVFPSAAQERVGVDSAVNPQATGSPPGGAARSLVIGQEVLFNERLATGSAGQAQVLFLDESALTIGPNSDVVVDQYVYDPKAAAGKLALNASRGVLRFVGGKLSKADNAVTLSTPSGTLGIRGGIFLAEIGADGPVTVVLIYGELTITGRNGVSTTLKRPGFGVRIDRPGDSPSEPSRVEPEKLAVLTTLFEGRAESTAGAGERPSDAMVAATSLYADVGQRVELLAEREVREAEFRQLKFVDLGKLQERLQLSTVTKQVIAQRFPALFGLSR